MSQISLEEVKKLAALCKITLDDDAAQKFSGELTEILNYVEQLDKVDTKDTEPTSQVTGLTNVNREDKEINYGTTPQQLVDLAPESQDGYVKVPRVLQ